MSCPGKILRKYYLKNIDEVLELTYITNKDCDDLLSSAQSLLVKWKEKVPTDQDFFNEIQVILNMHTNDKLLEISNDVKMFWGKEGIKGWLNDDHSLSHGVMCV